MGSALRPLALLGLLVLVLALAGIVPVGATTISVSQPMLGLAAAPALETSAPVAAASDRAGGPTYRAVIVGIANYQYINDLGYCDDDARDIYHALEVNGWSTANMALLVDAGARKSSIRQAILAMKAAAGPNDICLFAFSGHGSYDYDDDGDEGDSYDEFLCPYDTYSSASTMIRDDELAQWLSGFPTPNLCVILDSCYSGGMAGASGGPPPPPGSFPLGSPGALALGATIKTLPKPYVGYWNPDGFAEDLIRRSLLPKDIGSGITGVEVMMASREDQYSWEDEYLRNGVFSFFVVDCIQSWRADGNHDGAMSAEEVFSCAAPQAEAYVRRSFGYLMYPQFYDNHPGALVLIGAPSCPLPTCQIVCSPQFPTEGDQVCFTANAAAECGVASVDWDFGDGQSGSGETACHTFAGFGSFTVICTVTDLEGNQGSCWVQMRVQPLGCVCNLGLIASGCTMSSGRVGQTKWGQIAARNWGQEAALAVLSVTDCAGNVVFESNPTWIDPGGRVRMRFQHTFTADEIGRACWTWEVWSPGCSELTEWDNVRERVVSVLPRAQYCGGVHAMCAQYLAATTDVTVQVAMSDTYTATFQHVNPGHTICVNAASAGLEALPAETTFQVFTSGGTLLREDSIVTSCQQPIYIGQPFGAFRVTYLELLPPPG